MLALVDICAELCFTYGVCVCVRARLPSNVFPPAGGANQGKGCECFGGAIDRIARILRCVSCGLCFCVLNLHQCKTHKHAHNTCIQTLAHIIMCARVPYQYAHLLTLTDRHNDSHTRMHSLFFYSYCHTHTIKQPWRCAGQTSNHAEAPLLSRSQPRTPTHIFTPPSLINLSHNANGSAEHKAGRWGIEREHVKGMERELGGSRGGIRYR